MQRNKRRAAPLTRRNRPPLVHAPILTPTTDTPPTPTLRSHQSFRAPRDGRWLLEVAAGAARGCGSAVSRRGAAGIDVSRGVRGCREAGWGWWVRPVVGDWTYVAGGGARGGGWGPKWEGRGGGAAGGRAGGGVGGVVG